MKARALMKLRRPKEALMELETLKDIAPDESMVHFMLGRLYKMIGDKTSAIRHLTIALNLDPKVRECLAISGSCILTLCYRRHLRISKRRWSH
jgi:tetratricopeptide (TPR) repeat protein